MHRGPRTIPPRSRRAGPDARRSSGGPLAAAILLAALVSACGDGAAPAPTDAPAQAQPVRPNVVLLMADDLGWGDPGYMGNERILTPELDAMAAESVRLMRFYAASPSCSPTRASCLTGRHPQRMGIAGADYGHLPQGELTLPELLQPAGYRSGHFGKWHLGTMSRTLLDGRRGRGPGRRVNYSPPWVNGFDVCFTTEAEVPTWDPLFKPDGDYRRFWNRLEAESAVPYGSAFWTGEGRRTPGPLRGDTSRLVMDAALDFIDDEVAASNPFLAVVWFHAPHTPLVTAPPYSDLYADVAESEIALHYYGAVTAMDRQIGRLRRHLRDLGVEGDTLVWFCSDNGPTKRKGAPGSTGGLRGRKSEVFEGGIRVPALVEWPGRAPADAEREFLASTSDILPTVLELAGVDYPDPRPLDGDSLVGALFDGHEPQGRALHFEFLGSDALITDGYKLVEIDGVEQMTLTMGTVPAPDFLGLYDLRADPAESSDRSGELTAVLAEMRSDFAAWQASCLRSAAGEDYPPPDAPGDGGAR